MDNIFKNTYFGKPYKTRGNRKAILWYYHVGGNVIDQAVLITTNANQILVDGSGKDLSEPYHDTLYDIVSEWQEVDEDELDKLAKEASYIYSIDETPIDVKSLHIGFKTGYRKAKAE